MNLAVLDAVWLATAVLIYEKFKNEPVDNVDDVAFKQSVIKQKASKYTDNNVDNARISQWANGDHSGNTYNYLRDVNGKRRLTAVGEFDGEKERPNLNTDFSVEVNISGQSKQITVGEIVSFIGDEYTAFIHSLESATIDYLKILDHLHLYANEPYENPEKTGISESQKTHYNTIKKSGSEAVQELNRFASLVADKYQLVNKSKTNFHVAKKITTIRPYLWNQLVLEKFKSSPISLSLFAEKYYGVERIRIAIELDVKNASPQDMEIHQRLLDIPFYLDPRQYFYYVTYRDGSEKAATKSLKVIKNRLKKGEYTRVQLCYVLTREEIINLSNEAVSQKLFKAVEDLLPYYKEIMSFEKAVEKPISNEVNSMYNNNTILYGPPGTGKTYNTVLYAVAIIENKSLNELEDEDYQEILKRYATYKKNGQVQFTTFHQSYGYEEFIEGIKPVIEEAQSTEIQYEIKPGLFKEFCTRAQNLKVITNDQKFEDDVRLWKVSIGGSGQNNLKEMCFKEGEIRIGWSDEDLELAKEEGYSNDSLYYFFEEMKEGDIVFSLGDQKHIDAIGIIIGEAHVELTKDKHYPHTRKVQWLAKNIKERVYEMNGNKNLTLQTIYELRRISKEAVNQLINKYAVNSTTKVEENNNNYIFIIDEINRGNISKILGELITLIEPTKRLGAKEPMTVTLPYSQELFGVPSNVYILGTMNTADRSIALMDTALRRRFQFIEMLPNTELLDGIDVDGIDVRSMVEAINARIEVLYDREHTIGHAYFMSLQDDPTIDNLARIFGNAIIPLLQEYFYEDYSKIQLILGDNAKSDEFKFILNTPVQNVFKGYPDIDLPEFNYEIQATAFHKKQSYVAIYE